ncbi:histidine kinase [Flavobacterium sp. DG1-102-2]|uniref:histidine kinase n=1 Tax=Flavobacterium sp. DG1-102-2 TaxID=3081663 RepID=UPI002948D1E6|nr:histidine kinase [Flavobacterium sp. DG1-102-2]MDV6168056.1 histidine kinase [Flavobacterium sp. DG1-102-2]
MKRIYREIFRSLAIGTIIFVVLFFVAMANGKAFKWDNNLFFNFVFVMLYSVLLYVANSTLFVLFDKKFGKGTMSTPRLVYGFFGSIGVSVFIIFLLRVFEEVGFEGKSFAAYFETETLSNYYTATIITVVLTGATHAFYFYKRYQENKVKEQKIIAGTASAQFESLKNQIDPHFLFNSLNVLSSLIEENPDNAQRFTTSLSKIYRYVLEQKDKELISVQEELSFAKTYMNLLKMRFENSLSYELPEKQPDSECKVVPLSLQLLLENTIKHNVVSPQRPLHITIFEENGYLVVGNNLQKKEVLQDRRGVGLQNIVSRYAILTSRNVLVEASDEYFRVKLPILTKQVSVMETTYENEQSSYFKAQKKIEEIKGFYGNLASYIVVTIGLAILNLLTYPAYLWFLFPMVGWGIGVIIHGFKTYDYMPFLDNDWEERKVREIMNKEKSNRWK